MSVATLSLGAAIINLITVEVTARCLFTTTYKPLRGLTSMADRSLLIPLGISRKLLQSHNSFNNQNFLARQPC